MDVLLKDTSYPLIWYSIIFLIIGLEIYTFIYIMKSSFKKNVYYKCFLVVSFVPILGPILYLFIGRKLKLKQN